MLPPSETLTTLLSRLICNATSKPTREGLAPSALFALRTCSPEVTGDPERLRDQRKAVKPYHTWNYGIRLQTHKRSAVSVTFGSFTFVCLFVCLSFRFDNNTVNTNGALRRRFLTSDYDRLSNEDPRININANIISMPVSMPVPSIDEKSPVGCCSTDCYNSQLT